MTKYNQQDPHFDEEGVATDNPHLRRVSDADVEHLDQTMAERYEPDEVDVEWSTTDGAVVGRGVYLTIPCSPEAFTFSVDGPGTFTFDTAEAKGFVGIEWVDDEHDAG